MTDSIKTFLYIALFTVGFFIWQAWQKDFPDHQQINNLSSEHVSVNNDSPNLQLETTSTPKDGPSISPPAIVGKENRKVSNEDNFITVKTDTMSLQIDQHGGNIASLALLKYPVSLEKKEQPVQLLKDNNQSVYVAQSGLQSLSGPDTNAGQAIFQSKQQSYELKNDQNKLQVTLTWDDHHGLVVNKIFTFHRDNYLIDVDYQVQNQTGKNWQGRFYGQLKRSKEDSSSSMFGFSTYTGAAISSPDKRFDKKTFDDMSEKGIGQEYLWKSQVKEGWVAMVEHYFVSAWIPENKNQPYDLYSLTTADNTYRIGMKGDWVTVPSGVTKKIGAKLYAGPEKTQNLKHIAKGLELTVDYGIFWPFSQFLFLIMNYIHSVVGNWGISIILVTVLIKLCFYKLSAKSYRSMANMRRIQPKMTALKERYGDDRQKMSQAMMELYKKEKINPLGGCLPMVVQIPVFIALYWVLIESVELRQAPFYLWIHDLSVKDPFYILPILMGISMFIQQKLSPPPPDPMQAKMMMFMPVFFTALFLNFPAGLVLYWVVNNSLSIAQQWWITSHIENEGRKKA